MSEAVESYVKPANTIEFQHGTCPWFLALTGSPAFCPTCGKIVKPGEYKFEKESPEQAQPQQTVNEEVRFLTRMEKPSSAYIDLVDRIAANPEEQSELIIQREGLKTQLGNSETPDWEIYRGINFITNILLCVQRALRSKKN